MESFIEILIHIYIIKMTIPPNVIVDNDIITWCRVQSVEITF